MAKPFPWHLPFSVLALLFAACASSTPAPKPAAEPVASAAPAASVSAKAAPPAERPPPPIITVAMAGEPDANALREARLVTSLCEDEPKTRQQIIDDRIATMRREVDESFRRWVAGQPECWEEYREREKLWSTDAYGVGGLGLSGIGSGGGGRGSGAGFGSGHGRLGGTLARKATAASTTNNQIAGVDEADFVKTDGRYVYVATNGALRIVEAMNPRVLSVTRLPGNVREMFVEGDRAVVYTSSPGATKRCTYGYDCTFAGDGTSTTVLVLDVADRTKPKQVRQFELSGSLMAARRIGHAIHTVVADGDSAVPAYSTWPDGLDMCGTRESSVRTKFAKLKVENEVRIRAAGVGLPTLREKGKETALCVGYRTAMPSGRAFTTLASFDLRTDDAPLVTATLQSRPGAVFASPNALYLSVVQRKHGARGWYSFYSSVDEVSEIHKFRIGQDAAETRYLGSGVVPGHVLNQFAMDEWHGYLRIATSKGRVPDPNVESVISVLAESGGNLVRVGAVDKIAPGEDIRAVRFDDDRGYIVTFKKTDPLFVIDLYDPSRPRVLGELKIPGYSTYMHRIDRNHLLSIGFDADEKGDFAYFDGVLLQLFDVTNPTDPKLIHREKLGTRGSSSEAATNHLAFNYFRERGLLAFPMTICEGGGDGNYGNELTFSGLLVYEVSVESGFKRLGGIDHGTRGVNCQTWWTQANSLVKRSIFLDELVYSIAMDRLKVQRMGQLGKDVADIGLKN